MEKLRVFYDLEDEGCAPEPIGAVHEECRDALVATSERMLVDGTRAGKHDRCLECE